MIKKTDETLSSSGNILNDPVFQDFKEEYASRERTLFLINKRINIEIKKRFFMILGENFQSLKIIEQQKIIKIISFFILLISSTGCILSIVQSEYNIDFSFDNEEKNLYELKVIFNSDSRSKKIVKIIRIINIVLTFLIICLLIAHYLVKLKISKLKFETKTEHGLFKSGHWKFLFFEIFLNIFTMLPNINGTVKITQRSKDQQKPEFFVDIIVTIIQLFFRSYHVIKFIIVSSKYFQYDAEQICLDCNIKMSPLFAIKSEFQEHPFFIVSIIFIQSILVFGYSVRSVEMFFMYGSEPSKVQDWRYLWNGFWCVLITMSTVGFGDLYPISFLGRIIVVVAGFWGTFLISLMVAGLTVAIEFDPQQSAAHSMLKAALAEIEYGKCGTIFFQTLIRFNNHINKMKKDPNIINDENWIKKRSMLFFKLQSELKNFRQLRKKKDAKAKTMLIEQAVNKINEAINIEMENIKAQIGVVDEVKVLLEKYSKRQGKIKKQVSGILSSLRSIKNVNSDQINSATCSQIFQSSGGESEN